MTKKCEHEKIKNQRFLASHITPHMFEPDVRSVMCCVFLCEDCGDLYSTGLEVLRGYMPDGTIPVELAKISEQKIANRKTDLLVEARAGQLMTQRLQEMEQAAKRAGATGNPAPPPEKNPEQNV